MRAASPLALLAGLALAGVLFQPVTIARVTTADGDTLACRRLGRDDAVTLVYTHSMYGGEVRETWRVAGDALVRERFETDNAAAAEYYATDGAYHRIAGGYEVDAPAMRTDALPFRVDQVGNHRLRVDGDEIDLADQVDGSAGAELSATRVPLIARIVDPDAGCDAS